VLSAEDLSAACERLYGEHTYTAHRADLLDAIRAVVPARSIRLGCRCVEVIATDRHPQLRFANGDTVEVDVVVGADGRRPRTTRIPELSHGRSLINHLPDGPEQRQRDVSFASADPLVANGWIYGYDPDDELAASAGTP
jgi:hypothetical protein